MAKQNAKTFKVYEHDPDNDSLTFVGDVRGLRADKALLDAANDGVLTVDPDKKYKVIPDSLLSVSVQRTEAFELVGGTKREYNISDEVKKARAEKAAATRAANKARKLAQDSGQDVPQPTEAGENPFSGEQTAA